MWTKDALVELATKDAEAGNLNVNRFLAVINRESGWDYSIQSNYPDPTGPNQKEDSWGLVQVNLPQNASTTRAMAQDPAYALSFMADAWETGLADHWTAYRQLQAKYGEGIWPE